MSPERNIISTPHYQNCLHHFCSFFVGCKASNLRRASSINHSSFASSYSAKVANFGSPVAGLMSSILGLRAADTRAASDHSTNFLFCFVGDHCGYSPQRQGAVTGALNGTLKGQGM